MTLPASDLVAVLDAILEGFQIIGPDFRYLHVNEAAARHGRSTKEELIGRTMEECYPGIEGTALFGHLRACLGERSSHVMENVFTFPTGEIGYFELRIEPVPQGVCVLSIDVTARKEAEAARARAEERLAHALRMEAIGKLSAGIAHDFNNLLSVMLGEGELALARPTGPTREDVEHIVEAARTSATLTRQLLTVGRGSALAREVVDLADVVAGLENLLRRTLGGRIELQVEAPAGVGSVEADRSQLEQIVMNLVLNARDAIHGTGRITVTLSRAELDDDLVRQHPGTRTGPHVVLVVTDTGTGMDEATRARIFEPFFTTKAHGRGTGLGLATVYGILQQHGGSIWAYSELGSGATFKAYLPITVRAAQRPKSLRPSALQSAETILVVDDAPLLRKLIDATLSPAGFRVLIADSGEEALTLWDAHGASIGVVITDIMMPGIGGAELIRQLRAKRPSLPVICTSGYSGAQLGQRGAMPDDVVFVEKPFSPRVLLEKLRSMLAAP